MRRPRPKEQQWDACSDRVKAAADLAAFAANETREAAQEESVEQRKTFSDRLLTGLQSQDLIEPFTGLCNEFPTLM